MLVDAHAHLDMEQFDPDRDAVIGRALASGLVAIVSPGVDLESSRQAIRLAERYDQVHAAVGFHPHEAARLDDASFAELVRLGRHRRVVAVGEIGLDFYRNLSPRDAQIAALTRQLDLAATLGLPVVVHDREAHDATLSCIQSWVRRVGDNQGRPRGMMHCFSGDLALARAYVELGFLVSIAGPITYPRSEMLSEVARGVGLESLLVETDCPYLTPVPYRGKRNEPAYVAYTAAAVAAARGAELAEVEQATTQNAWRLFRLPGEPGTRLSS